MIWRTELLRSPNAMKYFKALPRTLVNLEVARQGIRSSGSVGANFIEANEALSRKDFGHRVRICRKEAKETIYWLRLSEPTEKQEEERTQLITEVTELMRIFGAILRNHQAP